MLYMHNVSSVFCSENLFYLLYVGCLKTTCTVLKFLYLYSFESLPLFVLILFGNRLSFCKVDLQNNGFPKTKKNNNWISLPG